MLIYSLTDRSPPRRFVAPSCSCPGSLHSCVWWSTAIKLLQVKTNITYYYFNFPFDLRFDLDVGFKKSQQKAGVDLKARTKNQ